MWNRKFKIETMFVIFNEKFKENITAKDIRKVKKTIYSKGIRGQQYNIKEIDENGELINEWIYKYLENGVIFTKHIYSKWEELKKAAKSSELQLFNNF
jgi:anionic cell wall polymer biosynthesis LytR-Cps2A-Psr (LCP) family protein